MLAVIFFFQDMCQLLSVLIGPIATYNDSVLFYSSVAQVWMIWVCVCMCVCMFLH